MPMDGERTFKLLPTTKYDRNTKVIFEEAITATGSIYLVLILILLKATKLTALRCYLSNFVCIV